MKTKVNKHPANGSIGQPKNSTSSDLKQEISLRLIRDKPQKTGGYYLCVCPGTGRGSPVPWSGHPDTGSNTITSVFLVLRMKWGFSGFCDYGHRNYPLISVKRLHFHNKR